MKVNQTTQGGFVMSTLFRKTLKRIAQGLSLVLFTFLSAFQVQADDTEVFFKVNTAALENSKTNIMFIMDEAASMNGTGQFTFDGDCFFDKKYKKNKDGNYIDKNGNIIDSDGYLVKFEGTESNRKKIYIDIDGNPVSEANKVKGVLVEEKTDLEKSPDCYNPKTEYKRPEKLPDAYINLEPVGNKCYKTNKWYFFPSNDLSAVTANGDCPGWTDRGTPENRLDREIDPEVSVCKGLKEVINGQAGGATGQFLGLYMRGDKFGGITPKEQGWYALDREYGTIERAPYVSNYGGLSDTSKIVALECRTDTLASSNVHGASDGDNKYPIDNSFIPNETLSKTKLKEKAWTTYLPSAHSKEWENSFGGLYRGNYLNFIRYSTKKEKRARKDIFKMSLKRYIERADSNVRIGLASFKQARHWGGRGDGDGNGTTIMGITTDGAGSNGNSDGGNIDVPIRSIDEVHKNFKWFVDPEGGRASLIYPHRSGYHPQRLWNGYAGWFPDNVLSLTAPTGWWDRDIKHREWLWTKVDEYFSQKTYGSNRRSPSQIPLLGTPAVGVNNEEGWVYTPRLELGGGAAGHWKSTAGVVYYRPLGELLYEVGRYFKGQKPKFGAYSRPETYTPYANWNSAEFKDKWGWDSGVGVSSEKSNKILPGKGDDIKYQSPVMEKCQANAAIILTDYTGENVNGSNASFTDETHSWWRRNDLVNEMYPPFNDKDEISIIETMIGKDACKTSVDAYGTCLPAVAKHLAETDLNTNEEGKQVLRTFVLSYWDDVAFKGHEPNGIKMLRQTAHQGGGKLIRFGSDLSELDRAIGSILNLVGLNPIGSGTFVAPASSVDLSSRLQNDDEIYYSLFEPSDKNRWHGNLKRYRLGFKDGNLTVVNADCDTSSQSSISTCEAAVNGQNEFTDTAKSAWTTSADKGDVKAGGALPHLPEPSARKVFTDAGVNPTASESVNLSALTYDNIEKAYGNDHNKIAQDFAMTEISSLSDLDLIAKIKSRVAYAQGFDATDEDVDASFTDTFRRIGDPLHSQPKLVNYNLPFKKQTNGEFDLKDGKLQSVASVEKDSIVFFGTNEGYIHAIDALNGEEVFSFMPKAAYGALGKYMDATIAKLNQKPYGMDGEITVWVNDLNGDGDVIKTGTTLDDDEGVYLFAGMRRGGNSYYALDVSDLSEPKLMWRITGDEKVATGTNKTPTKDSSKFYELGQSWAKPVVAKMKIKGKETPVVIIAGGYDGNQDDSGNSIGTDTTGRGIYILKAKTGERVWATGYAADADSNWNDFDKFSSEMTSSFPATPTVFDADGDTYIDTIIAADSGGKVWRIDIDQEENAKTTASKFVATVDKIANLSGSDAADARRFFVTPDVMLDRSAGADASLTIVLGSGRRPSPLNTQVDNRFYVLRSSPAFGSQKDDDGDYEKRDVITESDLLDATEEDAVSTALSGQSATNSSYSNFSKNGFYIRLGTVKTGDEDSDPRKDIGEKVITDPIIFNGYVVFSSYIPGEIPAKCGDALGDNRFNAVNITNPDVNRFTVQLKQHGIAPRPSVLILNDGTQRRPAIVVGTEVLKDDDDMPDALKSLYTLSRDKLIKFWTEK